MSVGGQDICFYLEILVVVRRRTDFQTNNDLTTIKLGVGDTKNSVTDWGPFFLSNGGTEIFDLVQKKYFHSHHVQTVDFIDVIGSAS